jgi:PhnB protein
MPQINTYLTFNGNCREAMKFYHECLGGNLSFQTIGDSPMASKIPAKIKKYILNAVLTGDNLILMGSDMVGDEGLFKGNSVSLMLECLSEREILEYYNKLSRGASNRQPPEVTHWGALVGGLTDKFGNHWLFHLSHQKN